MFQMGTLFDFYQPQQHFVNNRQPFSPLQKQRMNIPDPLQSPFSPQLQTRMQIPDILNASGMFSPRQQVPSSPTTLDIPSQLQFSPIMNFNSPLGQDQQMPFSPSTQSRMQIPNPFQSLEQSSIPEALLKMSFHNQQQMTPNSDHDHHHHIANGFHHYNTNMYQQQQGGLENLSLDSPYIKDSTPSCSL